MQSPFRVTRRLVATFVSLSACTAQSPDAPAAQGTWQIAAQFDYAAEFSEGLAAAQLGEE